MARFSSDPFSSSMDDIFNQLMGEMNGFNSESSRYLINGREVTPEEFQQYRQTGKLPQNNMQTKNTVKQPENGILAKLGRNLTQEARDNQLDPVIGRNKEIQETAEILSRRTKNNPVLVGDAGVGKTAVVEGLAQAIVHGDVPNAIKNKEIISIDISSLEAGTQYRGSFEENIQKLVKEVKDAGNVILFFDEIHQILGAGSAGDGNGSKGLADILKPALSRGEISVIGATTQDEYRNTIMKNAALARRFNEVQVKAPSAEDTFKILQGIRTLYEKHHNVVLPDSVLKAAVDYSIQYIPQRSLPDKAIDLIDMTAAHLAAKHPVTDVKALEEEIEKERQKQDEAATKEDFKTAQEAKDKIKELQAKADAAGRKVFFIATVCGTRRDYQGYDEAVNKLKEAGVIVCENNKLACQTAIHAIGRDFQEPEKEIRAKEVVACEKHTPAETLKELLSEKPRIINIGLKSFAEVVEEFDGALSARGARKAARFVEFCDAFNIPVLTLTNVNGFAATMCQEKNGAKASSKLVYAFANATVPKVNLIIGDAIGSAYVTMNSKATGADIVYAWPTAKVGMMEAKSAVEIMYADEIANGDANQVINEKVAEYQNRQQNMQACRRAYSPQQQEDMLIPSFPQKTPESM